MADSHRTLTTRAIEALKPTGKVYRVRDLSSDLKGFHVVVSAKGAKTFALAFTSPETGARRFLGLGSTSAIKLAEARQMARLARERIRDGVDPVQERKRLADTRQAEDAQRDRRGTVADVCHLYVRDLRRRGAASAATVEGYYFGREVVPYIGARLASEISEEDIADVLARITQRGALTLANRVRGALFTAFKLARRAHRNPHWRGRPEAKDFALTRNPVEDVEADPAAERVGERFLTAEEVKILWTTFDQGDRFTPLAIKLIMATGQRVEEVLHAKWAEFDLESDTPTWTLPASRRKQRGKVTVDHLVPLTGLHLELLDQLPRVHGSPYLFPAPGHPTSPRSSNALATTVRRFCKGAGFEPWSPRDLRRTWKTLAGSIGLSLEVRNRIQGHAFRDIGSRHYDRFDYLDEKRAAMSRWANYLQQLVTGEPAKVVSLRGGRHG